MGMAMKRGRPKNQNAVRDSKGKSRGEIVDFSTVFNQPHRKGQADPASHLHGTALGRLRVRDSITEYQLRVGLEWIRLASAYRRALSAPSTAPRSGEMAERVNSGFYNFEGDMIELDPDEARKRRLELGEKYNLCFENLAQIDRTLNVKASRLVRMVCIEDRDPSEYEIGDIRIGLNCIGQALKERRG